MPFTKSFDVNYYKNSRGEGREFSHKYRENWDLTEYHCPHCGKNEVWHETGGGDYDVGEEHICTNCNHHFYLPDGTDDISNDVQGEQRLKVLKA